MFNPEKLLGGLLRSGSRRRGLGSLVSGGVALGIVGVAMEAVDHYMKKSGNRQPGPTPPLPRQGRTSPPPVPPPGQPAGHATVPPPPLDKAPGPPPGPPMAPETAEQERDSDAVLLIRAMIAAANADGSIDGEERKRILNRLQSVELSHEEQTFIVNELLAPKGLGDIARQVSTREMARQVYAVSLMAIEVDTEAERNYLNSLANRMGLDDLSVREIHQQLGLSFP